MSKLREAVDLILEAKPAQAEDILFEHTTKIFAQKLTEMKKMVAAERFGLLCEEVSGNDIYAHGDHIGHIEHGQHNGKDHYRIVSYTETQPPEEHHKSLANAHKGAHKFIQAHVAKHDYETGHVHEDEELDEDHGTMHGEYRVSRPDRAGHSVYHTRGGEESYIGATETMSHRDPKNPHHQVYAHHSSGITKHPTHERAVQHIIDKHKELGESVLDESHKNNTTKQGRTKLVKIRVRGGKVQRRKRLSNAKGFIMRGGHLSRMSATEKRHRKMGARKAKIKRRSKKSQIHRKLVKSLRKRHQMGL